MALSLVCFVGELLCKSIAIVVPLWLVIWDVQRGGKIRWVNYIPYAVATVLYLIAVRQFVERAVFSQPVRSMGEQVATQFKALLYYLYLAFAPFALNVDHAFNESTPADPLVWLCGLCLVSLCFWALRSRR